MIKLPKFRAFASVCLLTVSCVALQAHPFVQVSVMDTKNHATIQEKYISQPSIEIEPVNYDPNEGVRNRNAYFPNLENFLAHFLRYPASARENAIEGTVKVAIDINPEGEITAVSLVQSLGYGCDETVLDLVKHMPRWTPRLRKGVATAQTLILPVTFKFAE